ncbi:DUF2997 domain-containing protein [Chloroflexi bacterium TSY]|nr:DUF2997 domain-containing protein [Chloroflexi bacterium TSY]
MQSQEIEILVHPDGTIEYTIKGIKGSSCESVSALLEQLGELQSEERTSEYYEYGNDAHITISAG